MTQTPSTLDLFNLGGRVAIVTGGAGLLGQRHARAIASAGGIPVLVDLEAARPADKAAELSKELGREVIGAAVDITKEPELLALRETILSRHGRIDILVNNAANNPKVEAGASTAWSRLENLPLDVWNQDLAVGLTAAFLCARTFGAEMARRKSGVIVNVASDLAVIAPDQRLYRVPGVAEHEQPSKPVTYSVVKTGLIGLTRYLATYYATSGVRVNAISPGGVYNGQPDDFVARLSNLIPLGRMAKLHEYEGALLFLCSDASSYMTGTNLVIDGGRTCW
jgi:NAD(P)-dependent dehydrogenase (short-subunit alcohol dehydrogenase family)